MTNPTDQPGPAYPNGSAYGYPTAMQEEKPINWRKYIFLFVKNWYWFLIVLGIALGVAFFRIRYTIPKYQARATLIIEEDESSQDLMSEFRSIRYFRRRADLANETAKLSSFTTIKRAVDSLDQDVFWKAHGRIRVRPLYNSPRYRLTILSDSIEWYNGKEWYIDYIDKETYRLYRENSIDTILEINKVININDWKFRIDLIEDGGHNTYSFIVYDNISLTKLYKGKLEINTAEDQGSVITISSTGTVGEREVDFLNQLSQTYIQSGLERKQTIADNTFKFIDAQINVILDSLNQSENQLLTFRLSNNVINLSREGEIAYQRLKSFHDQRTQLKLQENYYKYLQSYIENRKDPQTVIAPTLVETGDQLLIAAVQELQAFYKERENLDLSARADNPGIENINDRIQGVRLRILEIIKGLIENNDLTREQINTEEQAIISQLKTLPLNEQQLLNIKRKYDLYNQFYTFLLQKRAEAGIQKASTISNVRILDPARNDQLVETGGDKRIELLIAILLGLFIPGGIILLRDLLDNRIREREDITHRTDLPIIGLIGHAEDKNLIVSGVSSTSGFTESLRRIRTNISFALRKEDQKVILVTSSISGEGKTFSAANLATIIALNNKKVCLLGCDLRKPTLHRSFNIKNDTGVTSFIIGQKTIKEVSFKTTIKNLEIIPAGPVPPNPAELIETPEMRSLFDQLRNTYDYIIVDTPPLALVADALALAIHADLTLYVVRQNFSSKNVLEIANSLQKEEKLPKTYLLINDMMPSRNMGLTYYYGYGKGYNYGYYYYSDYNTSDQ